MDSELLDFIITYKKQNDGIAPSIREMARFLRRGHMVVYETLEELEKNGNILRRAGARNIVVNGGRWLPPA